MSKSLMTRIEALERAAGVGREPLTVILATFGAKDGRPTERGELCGYEDGTQEKGFKVLRDPGESDTELLTRAERAASGHVRVLRELRS